MVAKKYLKKDIAPLFEKDVCFLLIYPLLFSKEELCSYHILFQQVYNHPR